MGKYWLHDFPQFVKDNYPELGLKLQPGYETRSRSSGGFEAIMGVCCHHDAGGASQSTQARADYSCRAQYAPIGNFILGVGGLQDVIMIAAGASNTQGKGGPYKTSKGTVPVDDGNRRLIAIEAANTGTGSQDWNPAQQVAYLTLAAALIECYGLKSSDVISHSDWTNPVNGGRTNVMSGQKRKIDPGGGATPGRDWAEPKAVYKNMWVMDRFARDIDQLIAARKAPEPQPDPELGPKLNMQIVTPPTRIHDTRLGDAKPAAGKAVTIKHPMLKGHKAAHVTLTAINPGEHGHAILYASGIAPMTSNINYAPGATVANTTITELASDGSFQLFTHSGAVDYCIDLVAVG